MNFKNSTLRNKRGQHPENLSGQRFGRLMAVRHVGQTPSGNAVFACICDCDAYTLVPSWFLRVGKTKSCGCGAAERMRARSTRHGHSKGGVNTRTYRAWVGMRMRCRDPNYDGYMNYGGRGIGVCQRWSVFENFLEDMGVVPEGMSLDRIDVNGNYEPSNCRWATLDEQNNNKQTTRLIEWDGKVMSVSQWARHLGIGGTTLSSRVLKGWPIDKAFTKPVKRRCDTNGAAK